MLWKKTVRFWTAGLAVINLLLSIWGCTLVHREEAYGKSDVRETEEEGEPDCDFPEEGGETATEERGYNLPVKEEDRKEAEDDCRAVLERVSEIYREADKGTALNVVLTEETMIRMKELLKETGKPVIGSEPYSSMENYGIMESFLEACRQEESGEVILYQILSGGIERLKYTFDGKQLYVLAATATWNKEEQPVMSSISLTRIKEWEYTKRGWFCYELCVPEPPEVTEIVNGSRMIRVKPMPEKQRDMSLKYVVALGYQGNNLLCSSWDESHMEDLDFNGLFEYLYKMKYGEAFAGDGYEIPAELFESVITAYLPVTAQELRTWAVFDGQKQTYAWESLGCFNYAPTFFGTAVPEVTDIKENGDGTVTLTVEAVCSMVEADEARMIHELTVHFEKDGSFQYISNKILDAQNKVIPDYQYRVGKD